jgi:hypothetical protein
MRRRMRRAGWVMMGAALGLALVLAVLLLYLRLGQVREVRTAIGERLQIPAEALRVERLRADGSARISLRNVGILGEGGDTIAFAPRATLWFNAHSLAGDGPMEFYDVELRQPTARLVQAPDGTWNLFRAFQVTVDGQPIEPDGTGRPLLFRDVRLLDGRVVLALPAERPEAGTFAARMNLPWATIGGRDYQSYTVTGLNARLPRVLLAGAAGWQVDVGSLTGQVQEPNLRIAAFQGNFESVGEDGVRFAVPTLQVGGSRLAGEGLVRFTEPQVLYDVRLRGEPLQLADLRPLLPDLPLEGVARFDLGLVTTPAGRLALAFSTLDVEALDSRVAGSLTVALGGGEPLAFGPTDLRLDPLRLADLERLGLVGELPVLGTLSGTIATAAFSPETEEGRLQVNLAADLVPRDDPAGPPSRIVAVGPLAFGGADSPVSFDGLRLQLQPLQLATLRALAPERAELLRGELRGFVQLGGTTRDLRIAGGELVYQVGDAPPSRLAALSGRIEVDPLTYDVRARAEPLALATLTELFPALPFQAATVSGPLRVTGDAESVAFDANLTGPAGGIRFAGSARFTDPLQFDVSGQLAAFTAAGLLRADVPLEGPVSGTFAARGTTQDLRFDVDLTQALGRFVLGGRVRTTTDPPLFDVAGRVENFRVGALLGQPALFPAPMTGAIAISGGAAQPYSYAVDLRGNGSVFDLAGIYRPGPVPVYTARGQVLGLQLHRLPYDLPVPVPTVLNASVDLDARGTSLQTLAGTLWLDARGSLLGGVPVDRASARLAVQGGVLAVDTLALALRGNTVTASGQWGLTQPAPAPLRFSINAPNLDAIARAVPTAGLVAPQLTGSLLAEGWLAGTAEYPQIAVNARGRRLRFEDFRAGTLALDADLRRVPGLGWSGRAVLDAENAVLFANQEFQVVRVEASGTGASLAAGIFIRQDANRVLSASGILEMEGVQPRAVALETLNLRLAEASWELVNPTRLQWGGVQGLEIQNLALQRTGEVGGWLQVDGRLPPTGAADLRINARDVDLADARRIWARAPDIQGRLTLDAVLEGPATAPEMTIAGRVDGFRYQGATADVIVLDAEYLGQRLVGNASIVVNGIPIAAVEGTIPILLSYENFVPSFEPLLNEPLVARVQADSLPLDLVAAFTPGLARGRGVLQSQVTVGGTLAVPTFAGFARLQGGEVTVEELGIRLVDMRVAAAFDGNTIRIDTLQARSGGYLSVGGLVIFEPGSPPRVNLAADLNGFRAVDNRELGRLTTSGRIALAGPVTAPVLTGRLNLEDSQLNIPEMSDPALDLPLDLADVGPGPLTPVDLDPPFLTDLRIEGLEVTVGDAVWIVSNDMRVQIVGDIVIYRTAAALQVWGSMQTVRGRYTLRIGTINRDFDVVSGTVRFMGTPEINPAVDIVAANRVRTATAGPGGDLVILVHVTGTLASPQIALTSDTPVPISESELLSYLIFGRPTFELGGAAGVLAQQILVQEVLGGLVAAELERPFLEAGICDYVRVRPGLATFGGLLRFDALGSTLGGAAIECGRQIAEGLFLTLETGIGGLFGGGQSFDWGVGLEWQINEEWQWELQYGPVRRDFLLLVDPVRRYQLSTDIRRRWEYGGTRRRSILDAIPERTILPGEPMPLRIPLQSPEPEPEPPVEPAAVVREEEPEP